MGATSGAATITMVTCDSTAAPSRAPKRSRITARARMGPTLAPIPWRKRKATSTPSDPAAAHAKPATVNSASPPSSTGRLPTRSESGPQTSCPAAYPARNRLRVSCTAATSTPNTRCSCGMAGSDMSMDRAVIPVSAASSSASPLRADASFTSRCGKNVGRGPNGGFGRAPGCAGVGLRLRNARNDRA